jgi:acyl-CoA reductase-like NAD-dependent aldehyde dehydrogenase
VQEAVAGGARLVVGGPLPDGRFAPAVLDGVTDAVRAGSEPVDAPLLAVTAVASTDAAIAAVADLPAGPGISVWTADRYEGERIARALRAGATWLNDHRVVPALPAAPWGGGAGGVDALRAFSAPRAITWDPPAGAALWWAPYDATLERAGRAVAQLRSVRDRDRERALRQGPLPLARVVRRALRGR